MLWTRRSANQGNATSEHYLALLYADGLGVPRDVHAAVTWLERAAKQGFGASKQELRNLAAEGVPEAAAALRRLGP